MKLIEILYISSAFASVLMSIPQLFQLWHAKRSDELSFSTWITWFFAQLTSLFYAIAIKSVPYLLVSLLWISFYISMLILIYKFRPQNRSSYATVAVTVDTK